MKIVLTVLPRQETEEEKKMQEDKDTLVNNLQIITRALTYAKSKKERNASKGLRTLADLLDRPPPLKNGKVQYISTQEGRDWAMNVVSFAEDKKRAWPDDIKRLEAKLQERVRERDELFDAGLTLSGDIYRVVGFDRDKTTAGKFEGGVIVKAYEIKNPDPKNWNPKPVVVIDPAVDGRHITYLELPPVPEKLIDAKEVVLTAPQPNVQGLKLHGLTYLEFRGKTGTGPKVRVSSASKPLMQQLIFESGEQGVSSQLLCNFQAREDGTVMFRWTINDDSELKRAFEMVRCSVLEIDRGNEKQFISFLKPIQIARRLREFQRNREANTIYWQLPADKPLYLERWPLLVNGLAVHIPPAGKHSPKKEDLRSTMPLLETLTKVHNVGVAQLKDTKTPNTSDVFMPAVSLVMLPRESTEEEKGTQTQEEYEKLQERGRELIRNLRYLKSKSIKKLQIRGLLALADLLDRPPPLDKNGKVQSTDTKEGRDWMLETQTIAQQEIDDLPNRLASLNAMIQKHVRERDELFDSGITLSGDIYRVVGFDRDKTTAGKIEGGVIVKVIEIADEAP